MSIYDIIKGGSQPHFANFLAIPFCSKNWGDTPDQRVRYIRVQKAAQKPAGKKHERGGDKGFISTGSPLRVPVVFGSNPQKPWVFCRLKNWVTFSKTGYKKSGKSGKRRYHFIDDIFSKNVTQLSNFYKIHRKIQGITGAQAGSHLGHMRPRLRKNRRKLSK